MTAAPLIAPLIPPRTRPGGREQGRSAAVRRLPVAAAPGVPAVPDDVLYGFGWMDESGRVADRAMTGALGWLPGDRLTLTAAAGVVIAPPILAPKEGFLFLDRDKFHASFAGDVPAGLAAFMADSQVPWGVNALGGTITEAAWRIKPSWYLVTGEHRMIPPSAQRSMAERTGASVTEVSASHSVYVSQPAAVAALIAQAAARG